MPIKLILVVYKPKDFFVRSYLVLNTNQYLVLVHNTDFIICDVKTDY